jgi:hypothetical protein
VSALLDGDEKTVASGVGVHRLVKQHALDLTLRGGRRTAAKGSGTGTGSGSAGGEPVAIGAADELAGVTDRRWTSGEGDRPA